MYRIQFNQNNSYCTQQVHHLYIISVLPFEFYRINVLFNLTQPYACKLGLGFLSSIITALLMIYFVRFKKVPIKHVSSRRSLLEIFFYLIIFSEIFDDWPTLRMPFESLLDLTSVLPNVWWRRYILLWDMNTSTPWVVSYQKFQHNIQRTLPSPSHDFFFNF